MDTECIMEGGEHNSATEQSTHQVNVAHSKTGKQGSKQATDSTENNTMKSTLNLRSQKAIHSGKPTEKETNITNRQA